MLDNLKRLNEIYLKIDKTEIHKKITTVRSIKLATIINRIFYYIEYTSVLALNKDIENFNYYKYNIILSITRNVMELFNAYEYYGEKGITKDEYNLRELCASLHETINEEDIDKKLKEYNPIKFNQFNFLYPASNYKNLIKSNRAYKESTNEWKSALLSGSKCYYQGRIRNRINILPKPLESAIYNMLSNYTHSYELALGYDVNRGNNGMYSGFYQAVIAIKILELYGAIILKDYISRRNLKKEVTKENIEFLKSLLTYEGIENTLLEWKNKYDFNRIYEI